MNKNHIQAIKIPAIIYLQIKDDDGEELEEKTWSIDSIYNHDVMYERVKAEKGDKK